MYGSVGSGCGLIMVFVGPLLVWLRLVQTEYELDVVIGL
jgi:hypothetical protein